VVKFIGILLAFAFALPVQAGFRAYNGTTDLKVVESLKCSTGVTCTKNTKGVLTIVAGPGAGSTLAGFLQGRVAATATTITSAQCGSTFYNAGAVEMELPEASTVLGCRLTFVTLNAANFDIDPDAADQILVQTDAAGDKIRNATLGNTVTIEAVSESQWAVVGILGTWTDAN